MQPATSSSSSLFSQLFLLIVKLALLLHLSVPPTVVVAADSPCADSCGTIPIKYPFGLLDGCGARQFRNMLNCTNTINATITTTTINHDTAQLFFQTPSGSYVVRSINYRENTMLIYDPLMSTCSGGGGNGNALPRHDFLLSDSQYQTIAPSSDTFFALLNCSSDSPVLHRLSRVCANSLSGHSCNELYSCPSFQALESASSANSNFSTSTGNIINNASINSTSPAASSPPCCFTRYDTLKYMTMEILDCTHDAFVYGMDKVRGIAPADWSYGINLSFDLPASGCDRCQASGGTCGFDAETEGALCICSATLNSTTACGAAGDFSSDGGESNGHPTLLQASVLAFGGMLYKMMQYY